ncbi:MAG TPA: D-alanine--D-alanine ligase family protein [Ktedonobacteraceae bacterium]|nr:D-alanine--D-alanine ligase family protein [Ktedonobacteraceae bacterium]
MGKKKLRIGLVFGGRSGEHEVSLASARAVMSNLDPEKYDVVPIGITKSGTWLLGTTPEQLAAAEQRALQSKSEPVLEESRAVTLAGDPTVRRLVPVNGQEDLHGGGALDVIFPVLHGPYGEDGTLQGLLDMANIPYVGNGVLGSAIGMDKEKTKIIFRSIGLPIVADLVYRRSEWERDPERLLTEIEQKLGYPCFVKPVNMGSSVGVNKAHNRAELKHAMREAAEYDRRMIIEAGINCRELECGVLGNEEPIASVVGEIVASNEFYDYDAKYIDNKSQIVIPADIPQEIAETIRRQAVQAFLALDLSGLARVDFFLDRDNDKIYINEVNTLPGFTEVSMYAKLWGVSGVTYSELLDRLIELALERYDDRQRNRTSR